MDTISVDIGYSYTKTHKLLIFPSRIQKKGDMILGSEVIYNGETYCVGFGRPEVGLNKVSSDVTKICGLYAICRSTEGNDIVLITGLPIDQYGGQKQSLRDSFMGNADIVINGKERRLKVHDVKVFPQGAGALYSSNIQGDAILVDIGGRTVDIAYFEVQPDGRRSLKKYSTLFCGVMPLFSKVIQAINSRYDLALTTDDGEKILKNGLIYNGITQDISFLRPIMHEHIQELKDELALNYPAKTAKVYVCGGGANIYKLGYDVLLNNQFANAIGFYRMGMK